MYVCIATTSSVHIGNEPPHGAVEGRRTQISILLEAPRSRVLVSFVPKLYLSIGLSIFLPVYLSRFYPSMYLSI